MFQQTITNVNIDYDVRNESRTFSSGDMVTGKISFELKKESKISAVSVEFRGMAHVHWSTSAGKNRRRHHSAKVDYFRLKSSILRDGSGTPPPRRLAQLETVEGEIFDLFPPAAAVGGHRLQAGTHVYPFTLQIPEGCVPVCSFHLGLVI